MKRPLSRLPGVVAIISVVALSLTDRHVEGVEPFNTPQPIKLGISYAEEPRGDRIHLFVERVEQGGLAEQLGIRPQETIVAIDGQPIRSINELRARLQAGPPIVLTVRKINGAVQQLPVAAPGGGAQQPGGFGSAPNAFDITRQYRLHNVIFGPTRSLDSVNNPQLLVGANAFGPGQEWRFVPAADGTAQYRITNGSMGPEWSLAVRPGTPPAMALTDVSSVRQLWKMQRVAGNDYQITCSLNGVEWAVGVGSANNPRLVLVERTDAANQRWTLAPLDVVPGAALVGRWMEYSLPANQPNGFSITVGPDQSVVRTENGQPRMLGKIAVSANQLTLIHTDGRRDTYQYAAGGDGVRFFLSNGLPANFYWKPVADNIAPPAFNQPTVISSETVANPPLPPANVEFANTYKAELWILVRDMRDDSGTQHLKVPAGQSQTVQLERDAGSTEIETLSVPLPTGGFAQEQRERQLPVPPRYRISVYEMFQQSVEIDATKKKQKLTGVNYSPKSVGMFALPPGGELQDGRVDAYTAAVRQKNTGAVDRIDPKEWASEDEKSANDPIQKALKSVQ